MEFDSLYSAGAEALEFLAGYVVGRGFFTGQERLDSFIGALEAIVIIIFLMAVADELSGQLVMHNSLGWLSSHLIPGPLYRQDMLRASASFEHPILLGTFCTIAGAILLYAERTFIRRMFYVGICLFGCILSVSSGPLLVFRNHHWRLCLRSIHETV